MLQCDLRGCEVLDDDDLLTVIDSYVDSRELHKATKSAGERTQHNARPLDVLRELFFDRDASWMSPKRRARLVRLLLNHGIPSDHSELALRFAAWFEDELVLREFLGFGASPHAGPIADLECAKYGAQIKQSSSSIWSAWQIAVLRDERSVLNVFKDFGYEVKTSISAVIVRSGHDGLSTEREILLRLPVIWLPVMGLQVSAYGVPVGSHGMLERWFVHFHSSNNNGRGSGECALSHELMEGAGGSLL